MPPCAELIKTKCSEYQASSQPTEYIVHAGCSWGLQKQTHNKKGGVSKSQAQSTDVRQIFPTGEQLRVRRRNDPDSALDLDYFISISDGKTINFWN